MAPLKDVIEVTLSSSTGIGGTFTASYPSYRTAEDYLGGVTHEMHSNSFASLFAEAGDFTISPGSSNITVSILRGPSLPAGTVVFLHLDRSMAQTGEALGLANEDKMSFLNPVKIHLGAPATADADGYVASQDLTAAGVFSVNTTAAAALLAAALDGVADVPRNVVAGWTNTAVITVTGTDEYGNVVVESSGSGTSFTGKKAFKTVTGISVSANVTGLTVGTGTVLGLPMFLADAGDVIKEIQDGVAATAGTIAAAVVTTPSATTGDIRGTYAPNSAPNGTRNYELIVATRDPAYKGGSQYAG